MDLWVMGPARFHCATLLLLLLGKKQNIPEHAIKMTKFPIQAETSQLLALVRSVGVNEVGW